MCARLLACPLCSQPSFPSLDALRAGLVNVATRPLACPVCDEMLLGIDKLTIHLFGHTIDQTTASTGEAPKEPETTSATTSATVQAIPIQSWSVVNEAAEKQMERTVEGSGSGIYIPIDEIETFRNLTAIKDVSGLPVANKQVPSTEMKAPSQVIFVQNVGTQPKIFSANLIEQSADQQEPMATNTVQDTTTSSNVDVVVPNQILNQETSNPSTQVDSDNTVNAESAMNQCEKEVISVDITDDDVTQPNWSNNANSEGSPVSHELSHTDRLADLVKNAQITSSPLGTFHEAYDCSKPPSPTTSTPAPKAQIKSSIIIPAATRTERCNICGFSFPDRNILILHKQLVHMIQEKDSNISPDDLMKNYPCHLCTKVFKMRGSLMVHMRVAHPGFNTAVHFAADRLQDAQSELKESTENTESGPSYNCPVCGKTFKREQHVTQHLKIHDGKQWECEICSKMFTTKYFLKKHKRLHSGEMPYKCNLCDKTFTFQQSFHKHRFYHKDDKPHTCTTCGRSFKELSTLHNHERIHTGEKPFACESCGKCFRQRVSYLVHRRIHTGVMPYTCGTCGKTFRYKVSQRNHKCPRQVEVDSQNQESEDQQMMVTSITKETRQPVQGLNSEPTQITNEENQYVLVMNDEGQHVLRKQSEIENNHNRNTNISEQTSADSSESNDFIKNIWNEQMNNQMEYKETNAKIDETISVALENSGLWNSIPKNQNSLLSNDGISKQFSTETAQSQVKGDFPKNLWNSTTTSQSTFQKLPNKSQSDNVTDFFSLVSSPLENGISSPSSEMEHLRLSSPVNNTENSPEAVDGFVPMNNSNNVVQVTNIAHESFSENNDNFSTLQNINEDSLKELLYSIVDK